MPITSTDPVADMLTRVRNSILVRKHEVVMPHSKLKEGVAKLLQKNGFVDDVEVLDVDAAKILRIAINAEGTNARITEITRLSTPGRRWYANADSIPVVKRGRGIVIVSTSKGLMTGAEAKAQRVGGELVCKVY